MGWRKKSVNSSYRKVYRPPPFNDYYEPFLGGGAVFFGLNSRIHHKAFLSDVNADLMLTYRMLQKTPRKVIEQLSDYQKKHSKEHYYSIREEYNSQYNHGQDAMKLAAQFIYLNKTCYNGLYRVNQVGRFNVPIGKYKNPKIYDTMNLMKVSEVLESVDLKVQSFEHIRPGHHDLVYCDPPYDETYDQYTNSGFNRDSQVKLREMCDSWAEAGARIIVSNSDTDFIRKTWKGYQINQIQASRNINCKASKRQQVTELLITSKK
ncbi:MAG: Dam family site-specific DNA-(adenine-N6)-methyltransferase [Flavobacteriaceae bacterium]|nr:Dam family site-specific DNA-(adenine-N6)-methyltransferase [Flavobacteriaceae bacterium]MCY4267533.1 Dam family site-specific DNA-(adenine-N6)-methyltransferase [Flavobacteriaceae bacterium]